jgi:hypothetical protein
MPRTQFTCEIRTYMPTPERDTLFRNLLRQTLTEIVATAAVLQGTESKWMPSVRVRYNVGTGEMVELEITKPEELDATVRTEFEEAFPDLQF